MRRDRSTSARYSIEEKELALGALPGVVRTSRPVKKCTESNKRTSDTSQLVNTTNKPSRRAQASPSRAKKPTAEALTSQYKKKSTVPRQHTASTWNDSKTRHRTRRSASPSRRSSRRRTPPRTRPVGYSRTSSLPIQGGDSVVPIAKKQNDGMGLAKAKSYDGPSSAGLLGKSQGSSSSGLLSENSLLVEELTACKEAVNAPNAVAAPSTMSDFFCGVHNWFGSDSSVGTSTSTVSTQKVDNTNAVVPLPPPQQPKAPTSNPDVFEGFGLAIAMGRSISLPFFGQTTTKSNESTILTAGSVRPSRAAMEIPTTIPEERSEDEEEEDQIIKSLSFNVAEATKNFGSSWGFESSSSLAKPQIVAETRDDEKYATRAVEEPHTIKKEDMSPPIGRGDNRKKNRIKIDESDPELETQTTKKQAVSLPKSGGGGSRKKNSFKIDESDPDLAAMEIRHVTSLVMDLTRETAFKDYSGTHPALRVVRVSSKTSEGRKKRLAGNKSPKAERSSGGLFATKKRGKEKEAMFER